MSDQHFTHQFDPVLFRIGDIEIYWYGLGYAIGFIGLHVWMMVRRGSLGWSAREVYDFSILFAVSAVFLIFILPRVYPAFSQHPSDSIVDSEGQIAMGETVRIIFSASMAAFAALFFWVYKLSVRIAEAAQNIAEGN